MIRRLTTSLLVFLLPALAVAADTVKLTSIPDGVDVTIGGMPFTTYRTARQQMKPYFWPVLAADGAVISRSLDKPEDHPHHKGIWCAIDEVNQLRFWAEKAKIENVSVEIVKAEGNPAELRIVNHWLAAEGQPLLTETVQVRVHANRRIDYDTEFKAGSVPVTFEDTKEGMFGIRVANSIREREGGKISNAEGLKTSKECWGKESKWVDYVGLVNGKTYGIALFDDPKNFRKSRFHVRDYGLFTLSPFGQKSYTNGELPADPLTIDPGKSIRLRYGLYIHEGDTQQAGVTEVYESFAKGK